MSSSPHIWLHSTDDDAPWDCHEEKELLLLRAATAVCALDTAECLRRSERVMAYGRSRVAQANQSHQGQSRRRSYYHLHSGDEVQAGAQVTVRTGSQPPRA